MGRHLQEFLHRHLWDPPWRSIKTLGGLRILGVSITTLLSVPLLARAIATSREHIDSFKLLISNPRASEWLQSIADSLQLPSTIKLLVLSALFALIGKAVYEFACPPYFRIGESYEEFRRKYSFATDSIQADSVELWNETSAEIRSQMLLDLVQHYGQSITFTTDRALWTRFTHSHQKLSFIGTPPLLRQFREACRYTRLLKCLLSVKLFGKHSLSIEITVDHRGDGLARGFFTLPCCLHWLPSRPSYNE